MANTKQITIDWSEINLTVYAIIKQEATDKYLDNDTGTFLSSVSDIFISLVEDGTIRGRYELSESRSVWADGTYTMDSMLGSDKSETGTSFWVGAQMPNLTGGKFGLEYNRGSEHWRPFTYGEDTMIGSKLAARGSAIEAYWTQPLIEDVFSMQVRYTQITYDYTGSNAFFGDGGTAMAMSDVEAAGGMMGDPIEKAQDIRVYFRYRY